MRPNLAPCPKCEKPTPSYSISRAKGETKGWCLLCADAHREANPPGLDCAKCGLRTLRRDLITYPGPRFGWCKICADKSPKRKRLRHCRLEVPLAPAALVRFRERFRLTQVQFAAAIGVSVPALSSWEQGHTKTPPYVPRAMSAFVAGLPPYSE